MAHRQSFKPRSHMNAERMTGPMRNLRRESHIKKAWGWWVAEDKEGGNVTSGQMKTCKCVKCYQERK